jgi:hypothetical protein
MMTRYKLGLALFDLFLDPLLLEVLPSLKLLAALFHERIPPVLIRSGERFRSSRGQHPNLVGETRQTICSSLIVVMVPTVHLDEVELGEPNSLLFISLSRLLGWVARVYTKGFWILDTSLIIAFDYTARKCIVPILLKCTVRSQTCKRCSCVAIQFSTLI